jgi:hypothetical protein
MEVMEVKADPYEHLKQFAASLRAYPWFRFIGLGEEKGEPVVIVYVSRKNFSEILPLLPEVWYGVPVRVRYTGAPKPAVMGKISS